MKWDVAAWVEAREADASAQAGLDLAELVSDLRLNATDPLRLSRDRDVLQDSCGPEILAVAELLESTEDQAVKNDARLEELRESPELKRHERLQKKALEDARREIERLEDERHRKVERETARRERKKRLDAGRVKREAARRRRDAAARTRREVATRAAARQRLQDMRQAEKDRRYEAAQLAFAVNLRRAIRNGPPPEVPVIDQAHLRWVHAMTGARIPRRPDLVALG